MRIVGQSPEWFRSVERLVQEDQVERGLHLCAGDPWLQAAHDDKPPVAWAGGINIVRPERRCMTDGDPQIGGLAGGKPSEAGLGNADDGENGVVETDGASDGGGRLAKGAVPVGIIKDRHGRRSGLFVFRNERAAQCRRYAQSLEVAAGDNICVDHGSGSVAAEIHRIRPGECHRIGKNIFLILTAGTWDTTTSIP